MLPPACTTFDRLNLTSPSISMTAFEPLSIVVRVVQTGNSLSP